METKKEIKITKIYNDYPWSYGAPLPFIMSDDYKTVLFYYMQNSIYNGKSMSVTHDMQDNIAFVEFENCYAHKLEGINEEVINAHPLMKDGGTYDIFIIENSSWIEELQKINSVHAYYNPEHWKDYKHYFFVFHDSMFQCIAEKITITPHQISYNEAVQQAISKIIPNNNEAIKIQISNT